jgi:protein subunit release factor A
MIDQSDIEVQVYRDDTTDKIDSAVRLRHKPTGIVVESWEHDTQIANRDAAMRELERQVSEAAHAHPLPARVRRWFGRFAKRS